MRGSIHKLETYLLLSGRIGLGEQKEIEIIVDILQEESKMIISLIKKREN